MKFTLATVLNTTVILGICSCFLMLLLNRRWYKKLPVKVALMACIAIMIRFLMPFEFPFTVSVYISKFWPHIYLFFRRPVVMNSGETVYLYQVLSVIWGAFSIFLLLRLYSKNLHLKRELASLPDETDPLVNSILDKINQQYKHFRHVRIAVSDNINTTPYITGILKPTIVLPDIKWDEQELSFILGHELTHFYNHHLHIKIVCEVISSLYFWNPFVHLLKRQIFKLLEMETDSIFTASMSDEKRLAYAECMLNMSRLQYLSPRLGTSFAPRCKSNLYHRMQILLGNGESKKKLPAFLLSEFVLLMFSINFVFVFESSYLPPNIQSTTIDMDDENTYLIRRGDTYDVYYEGNYLTSVSEVFDSSIPVYEED